MTQKGSIKQSLSQPLCEKGHRQGPCHWICSKHHFTLKRVSLTSGSCLEPGWLVFRNMFIAGTKC